MEYDDDNFEKSLALASATADLMQYRYIIIMQMVQVVVFIDYVTPGTCILAQRVTFNSDVYHSGVF